MARQRMRILGNDEKSWMGLVVRGGEMTVKQKAPARKNVKKAISAAKKRRTIVHLPKQTRTALGKEGAKAAKK